MYSLTSLSSVVVAALWSLLLENAQAKPHPLTVSLSSRPKHPKHLEGANIPLDVYFNVTELQWFGAIEIGTPPQKLTVVFDTGSPGLELPVKTCASCFNQTTFDPSKSKTFLDLVTNFTITLNTGAGADPVIGDNWQLQVRTSADTVSVGGLKVKNVTFFAIEDQTPTFSPDPFDGIMGMPSQPTQFLQSLIGQGLPAQFAYSLTPQAVGHAEFTLGGFDPSKLTDPFVLSKVTNLANVSGSWELTTSGIAVNGNTSSVLQGPIPIQFNTGTSVLLFNQTVAEAIYSLISPEIIPNPDEAGTFVIPCSSLKHLPAVIQLTFPSTHQGKPFNLTLPSSALSLGPFRTNASNCQTLINLQDGPIGVMGGAFFKHYYTLFDIDDQEIGFSPAPHHHRHHHHPHHPYYPRDLPSSLPSSVIAKLQEPFFILSRFILSFVTM